MNDINGNLFKFESLRNIKVILISNVATYWGITKKNYEQFKTLQNTYGPEKLKILIFPCNQFHNHEPGTNQEIKDWIDDNYPSNYIIFEKSDVNGDNTNPVFSWLRRNSELYQGDDKAKKIQWNFQKFVVENGKVVGVYHPHQEPNDFISKYLDKYK